MRARPTASPSRLRCKAPIFVTDKIALEESVPDKSRSPRHPQVQEIHRRTKALGLYRLN